MAVKKGKFKSHVFMGNTKWTGGRTWEFCGDDSPWYPGAPPERFLGEPQKLSPEDLMLLSISTCMISTFTSLARRFKFEPQSYESEIEGLLEHTEEYGYMFTKIVLRVQITVRTMEESDLAANLLKKSHDDCWMSNGIRAEVTIVPEITIVGEEA